MIKHRLIQILLVALLFQIAPINSLAQSSMRKVLIEEFTTASCGNCPMMSKYINDWHTARGDSSIVVAIHEGSGVDAMSSATTAAIFNAMHPAGGWFAPAVMIDRGVYPWVDPEPYLNCYQSWGSGPSPGVDSVATRLMREPAKVSVGITGTYNTGTRTLQAQVDANFLSSVPTGDWRINLFLVEDSVIGHPGLGPFVGWDQHCYNTTWANTNYPGMFDGTSIIGYPHRHVMRNSFFGNWGLQGIIPATPAPGTTYTATSSIVVDTAYHDNHLSLVAFVSLYGAAKNQKYVLNANEIKVSSSFVSSIVTNENTFLKVYPNPADNKLMVEYSPERIAEYAICSVYGQNVLSGTSLPSRVGQPAVIDISALLPGVYFIKMQGPKGAVIGKFVKQ